MNIPNNLEEALLELDNKFPEKEIEFIKSNPQSCMIQYHSGAGRWIRNNWGLWAKENNNLKTWFLEKGISHPDDMSEIILDSYWSIKNNKDIELDKQIKNIKITGQKTSTYECNG